MPKGGGSHPIGIQAFVCIYTHTCGVIKWKGGVFRELQCQTVGYYKQVLDYFLNILIHKIN